MPLALVIADAEWVVNDILASLPWGDWEVDVLDATAGAGPSQTAKGRGGFSTTSSNAPAQADPVRLGN